MPKAIRKTKRERGGLKRAAIEVVLKHGRKDNISRAGSSLIIHNAGAQPADPAYLFRVCLCQSFYVSYYVVCRLFRGSGPFWGDGPAGEGGASGPPWGYGSPHEAGCDRPQGTPPLTTGMAL